MLYEFLQIDRTDPTLLYEQLYKSIITAVASGRLTHGDKLPSIRTLAGDLGVSRTTVETAYDQLCAEGYICNKPKRGFFVEAQIDKAPMPHENKSTYRKTQHIPSAKYDFSGSSIDAEHIDIKFWKRCIKDVLDRPYVISSYGDSQGEYALREVLCSYAKSVRGVYAAPENIVIGAGTQTLLSVLLGMCSDFGRNAAIEKGFFPQGEQIFDDCGYTLTGLNADKNGIILNGTESRILFINSSGSIRGSAPLPINKRMEMIRWAETNDAVIIEDDYNGELRYTSKPVPALQSMDSDRVVYIGSFSKLLLPSVRISYMVLPERLLKIYEERKHNYNQTSSKAEQLALAEYIRSGRLERQLRKLRKLYAVKSALLLENLNKHFANKAIIEVIETALCVRMKLGTSQSLETLKNAANENGILLGKCREKNGLKYFYLSFAGIPTEQIAEAAEYLSEIWSKLL